MSGAGEFERASTAPTVSPDTLAAAPATPPGLRFAELGAPVGATERRQRRRGAGRWLRAAERHLSHLLARHVHGRIPGVRTSYDRSLERDITVATGEIGLPGIPAAFDGIEVLLISDIHAGPFVSRAALVRACARVGAIDADLILIGGDLVTCRADEMADVLPGLEKLRAPLGRYAVLGNHDHATGEPDAIRAALAAAGIPCLDNRSVVLERDGATLTLAGIDDLRQGRPDLDRALAGAKPPIVLLSHHPDVAFDAARRGVALVLAGHTHGGQIALKGLPLLVRQSRHGLDAGRYLAAGTEVVVSRGLGVVGVPLRVGSPPEVVRLTLRATGE